MYVGQRPNVSSVGIFQKTNFVPVDLTMYESHSLELKFLLPSEFGLGSSRFQVSYCDYKTSLHNK